MNKEGEHMRFEDTVILKKEASCVYSTLIGNMWRSNVKTIKEVDDKHFIEYTRKDYPTFYTVIKKEKDKLYCVEVNNNKLEGSITYQLNPKESETEISITLTIQVIHDKSPFLKRKLKKSWQTLLEDLKRLDSPNL